MPASMEATIVKIEEDQQLVFGWANIIKTASGELLLDRQNDFIDDATELEKAAYHYVLHSRDGGEMHVRKGVSTLVESVMMTLEKQEALGIPAGTVPLGWWIGFKVNDDRVWNQIKKGGYVGFSVHGTGRREQMPLNKIVYTEVEKEAAGVASKYIKRMENGHWCVYSKKGRMMGEYDTKKGAVMRLRQIEQFKKGDPTSEEVHVPATEWKKRKRKKRILTNAALEKFNQNHDDVGRFSSGPGGGGAAPKGGGKKRRGKTASEKGYVSSGPARAKVSPRQAAQFDKLNDEEQRTYIRNRFGRYKTRNSHTYAMQAVREDRAEARLSKFNQNNDELGQFSSGPGGGGGAAPKGGGSAPKGGGKAKPAQGFDVEAPGTQSHDPNRKTWTVINHRGDEDTEHATKQEAIDRTHVLAARRKKSDRKRRKGALQRDRRRAMHRYD